VSEAVWRFACPLVLREDSNESGLRTDSKEVWWRKKWSQLKKWASVSREVRVGNMDVVSADVVMAVSRGFQALLSSRRSFGCPR